FSRRALLMNTRKTATPAGGTDRKFPSCKPPRDAAFALLRKILVTAGLLSIAAAAADWPQWRGPHRTGISEEHGLLKQWPADGPKLLWQTNDLGDGYSTPAVLDDRVYLLSNRGMDNEFVQVLSARDGKQVWSTRLGNVGNPNQEPPYPMARSTPTLDG